MKFNVILQGGALDLLQDTDAEKNLGLHLAIENGHLELAQLCVERAKKACKKHLKLNI